MMPASSTSAPALPDSGRLQEWLRLAGSQYGTEEQASLAAVMVKVKAPALDFLTQPKVKVKAPLQVLPPIPREEGATAGKHLWGRLRAGFLRAAKDRFIIQ